MAKGVTRIGTATIIFNDGAVLEVKNNSNLLIREIEKGLIKKGKKAQREAIADEANPEFKGFTRDEPGFNIPSDQNFRGSES